MDCVCFVHPTGKGEVQKEKEREKKKRERRRRGKKNEKKRKKTKKHEKTQQRGCCWIKRLGEDAARRNLNLSSEPVDEVD